MWTLESLDLLKTTDFRGPLHLHRLNDDFSSYKIFKRKKWNQVIREASKHFNQTWNSALAYVDLKSTLLFMVLIWFFYTVDVGPV